MTIIDTAALGRELLKDPLFIKELQYEIVRNPIPTPNSSISVDSLIIDLTNLIYTLVAKRVEAEVRPLLEQNNKLLAQFREAMEQQSVIYQSSSIHQSSFSDIRRIINDEKRRVEDSDTTIGTSNPIFLDARIENAEEVIKCVRASLKKLQEKYQTNFKSVWNVVCLTESTLFEHIKSCNAGKKKVVTNEDKGSTPVQQNSRSKDVLSSVKNLIGWSN